MALWCCSLLSPPPLPARSPRLAYRLPSPLHHTLVRDIILRPPCCQIKSVIVNTAAGGSPLLSLSKWFALFFLRAAIHRVTNKRGKWVKEQDTYTYMYIGLIFANQPANACIPAGREGEGEGRGGGGGAAIPAIRTLYSYRREYKFIRASGRGTVTEFIVIYIERKLR